MRKIIFSFFLCLLFLCLFPFPVSAQIIIANPDSIAITSALVVQSTITQDDVFIAFNFGINYANWPTSVLASDSFHLILYDTNGNTILASSAPFVEMDNGYNANIAGFYLAPSVGPALPLTWNGAYKIAIVPNSIYFTSPPATQYYTLSSANYCAATDQLSNQTALQNYIKDSCIKLEGNYPAQTITTTVTTPATTTSVMKSGITLLMKTDVGIVLSTDGEYWMRNAMPGVASAAPALFYIQNEVPVTTNLGYTNGLSGTYSPRLTGSPITNTLAWIATKTGLDSAATVACFGFIIIAIIFIIICAWKGLGVEPGLIGDMVIIECGACLFGGTILNIVLMSALGAAIFIFFVLWLRRA